jgi:hypothetical protein
VAVTGVFAGGIAFALAAWGAAIMVSGLNTVSGQLDRLDHGTATPASQTSHAVTNQEARLVHQSLFIGNS